MKESNDTVMEINGGADAYCKWGGLGRPSWGGNIE